jgi:O-succinylbenzoic acid--CoA ligase
MLRVSEATGVSEHRLAVVAGEQQLTFGDLHRRVQSLAEQVSLLAGDPALPLAFAATPGLDSLLLLYALLETKRTALPVCPSLRVREKAALIEQAGAIELALELGGLRVAKPARGVKCKATGEPPAVLVATSGTTGQPKLVRLSRSALVAAADASSGRLGWEQDDRWLLSLSLAHVGGLSIVTRCLVARRPVVLDEPSRTRDGMTRFFQQPGITLASLVPTQLRHLIDAGFDPKLTRLRCVLLGGMRAEPELVARARSCGWPVLMTYGTTETASQIATQLPQDLGSCPGPCDDVGPPLQGVELSLVGEQIAVRGPMLFDGYAGDTGAGDPSGRNADGWFLTGDCGKLTQEGRLQVIGRAGDRIVTGGENVDPVEVELALLDLPWVQQACVFGLADEEWGELVAAAVVVSPGKTLDTTEFVEHVTRALAPFKRPRRLATVAELPLTPAGKLDRAATARAAAGRLGVIDYAAPTSAYRS